MKLFVASKKNYQLSRKEKGIGKELKRDKLLHAASNQITSKKLSILNMSNP